MGTHRGTLQDSMGGLNILSYREGLSQVLIHSLGVLAGCISDSSLGQGIHRCPRDAPSFLVQSGFLATGHPFVGNLIIPSYFFT